MNTRYLLLVFMVLGAAVIVTAQRTLTNADLERYRAERMRAEEQLRQQFAQKGLSYDEVMRRNRESQKEMFELSAKLRAERIEAERIQAQREASERATWTRGRFAGMTSYEEPYWSGGWFGASAFFGPSRFAAKPIVRHGYFAGGQFWPAGPATPPRPAFNIGRRH